MRISARAGSASGGVATTLAILAIAAGVGAWAYHKMQQSPAGAAQTTTANPGAGGTRATFDPLERQMSLEGLSELYNPEIEGTPEDWQLIVTLNSDEVQKLAYQVDSLDRNFRKYRDELVPKAQRIYPVINQVKPILWQKLLEKNWKDPKIPMLFHELAKDEPNPMEVIMNIPEMFVQMISYGVIANRIETAKSFLLGGKIRTGDRRFVEVATPYVEKHVAEHERKLDILSEMMRRLEVELRTNPPKNMPQNAPTKGKGF